jgi:cell division septum initiation protein DivIVA
MGKGEENKRHNRSSNNVHSGSSEERIMGYSLEFIKNLPTTMQQEVTNLNSQIESLEAKRSKLQLPVDIALSYDLLKSNKELAEKMINDANAEASKILSDANVEADTIVMKARDTSEIMKSTAEKTIREAINIKEAANTLQSSLDEREDKIIKKENELNDLNITILKKSDLLKEKAQIAIKALNEI